MNKLVKIAPIVVIVACAGSLFFAFKLSGVQSDLKAGKAQLASEKAQVEKDLATTRQQAEVAQAGMQQAQAQAAAADAEKQAAQVALGDKTKEADAAKARVTELDTQLQETKTKLATAEDTLQRIQEVTKSEDMQNIGQIREKLVALGEENKVLSQQLTSMRDDNLELKKKLAEKTETPAGLRGRVAAVQPSWGFLVLDIGQKDRVQRESYFIVYRDSKMIGKAQIVAVKPNTSIAELLPEYSRGTPRPGDYVIH
jgi:flagellar biosynthesis GTPase FlhF